MKSSIFLLCTLLFLKMTVVTEAQKNGLCFQPPISGHCYAYFVKYYYDPLQGRCREFVYGGCGGNLNRFDSVNECRRTCGMS
ncbi:PI-actitoxin-Aeq3a-like [Ixodes scapularis]|uniref:PI-actitoxin-Aeq3a-like n=1 Tax=Ixodes scapularis TaxID=6945 RepID=UPI001A9E393F|nr:PI-actitoxin-Aeq3a-like [Ixodes scapularis]